MIERHVLEQVLTTPTRLNERLDNGSLSDATSKALTVIRRIRQLAASICGNDARPYYLAFLFYATERIIKVDADVYLSREEVAPLFRAAISLGRLADRLNRPGIVEEGEWVLDSKASEIRISGHRSVCPTEWNCLSCSISGPIEESGVTRRLYAAAYPGQYDPQKDDAALNMVMSRLRDKIEPILTIPGSSQRNWSRVPPRDLEG